MLLLTKCQLPGHTSIRSLTTRWSWWTRYEERLSQLNANDSLEGGCQLERIELIAFSLQSHRAMLGVAIRASFSPVPSP